MAIVLPPTEVFEIPPAPLVKTQGGYGTFGWIRDVCPPEGGLLSYYKDEPYPRKGHVYPESVEANNYIKKITVAATISLATPMAVLPGIGFALLPWKFKVKWLEKILFQYCRTADYINRNHYMKRRFYNQFSKEIWDLVYVFLKELGISSDVAYRCGRVIAHMFELEDAYRARVQDIFNEASKVLLVSNPKFEISRLCKIYVSREKEALQERILALPKIFSLAMIYPKFKKAFIKTVKGMDMTALRYDEIDYYYILNRNGYNFLGREVEDRFQEYTKLHNRHIFDNLKKEITDPVKLENITQQLITLGISL